MTVALALTMLLRKDLLLCDIQLEERIGNVLLSFYKLPVYRLCITEDGLRAG